MTPRLIKARERLLVHVQTWQAIEAEHDNLIAQRHSRSARRRLESLYELFAMGTPSQAALNRWLAPPARKSLTDFKLYMLHRALTIEISLRISDEADAWETGPPLPLWAHLAVGLTPSELAARVADACDGAAIADGRGPSAAAVDLLVTFARFGRERTIWRAVERHRKQLGRPTPRPNRRRGVPVPSR
jgi:hypothetical protein